MKAEDARTTFVTRLSNAHLAAELRGLMRGWEEPNSRRTFVIDNEFVAEQVRDILAKILTDDGWPENFELTITTTPASVLAELTSKTAAGR